MRKNRSPNRIWISGVLSVCLLFMAGCTTLSGNSGLLIAVATSQASSVPTATARHVSASVTPVLTATAIITRATASPSVIPSRTPLPSPTEAIGRLAIPALAIDVPIVSVQWHTEQIDSQAVAMWDPASYAASYLLGTALPGSAGNCVIAGHSSSSEGAVFDGIWDLQSGDEINLTTTEGITYTYVVTEILYFEETGVSIEQRLDNATVLAATTNPQLTLITCWPAWAYTERVAVIAQLAEQ